MIYPKFMIGAKVMTDDTMRYRLANMGEESAPGVVVLLSRLAKQAYRRSSEEALGMHLRHLVALSYVRDHDDCPQQDLADAFCMDANNVVLLLNELEELGYASRVRDPGDRRRHLVRLTEAGCKALSDAEGAERAIDDDVLQALDDDERKTLTQLLTRALRGIEPADVEAYEATIASIST